MVTAVSTTRQIEMDFTPGLTQQYPELMDLVTVVVYGAKIGLGGVAAELDKSPSLLSRMLNRNPDEQRNLPLADLPKIIHCTGDLRIVHWLVEKYCEDSDAKRKRALDEIPAVVSQLQQLLEIVKKK
jgi:hypothetical protein